MNDKAKFLKSFVLGFILGGVVVFSGIHFYHRYCGAEHAGKSYRKHDSKKMLEKLTRKLELSAGQKGQIEKILEDKLPQIKALRKSVRPQLAAVRESMRTEIRKVLNPEQQAQFNQLVAEFDARGKKWEAERENEK